MVELVRLLIGRVALEHMALTMPPPRGEGAAGYWRRPPGRSAGGLFADRAAYLIEVASGWCSGCNASPRCRVDTYRRNSVSSAQISSSSAIAGKRTPSQSLAPAHGARDRPSGYARGQVLVQPVHDQDDRTVRVSFSRL